MIKTFEIMQHSSQLPIFCYTIVPTMFDKRTKASQQSLETVRELYGRMVWDSVIPIDTKFRDASHLHVPHIYARRAVAAMPIWSCLNICCQKKRMGGADARIPTPGNG